MSQFISNIALINLLKKANQEELTTLTKLLDDSENRPWNPEEIQKELCECGGHAVTNIIRGEGTSYFDILDDVCDNLDVKGLPTYYSSSKGWPALNELDKVSEIKISRLEADRIGLKYTELAEEKILLKLLEKSYEKMSPSERKQFENKVNEVAQQFGADPTKKLAGTAGIMALGNLGGFATYTFLTTTMSALSMGTLGFGAYTTATSALSVFLGPVGWLGLGAAAVYSYGKPKYKKLIPVVATIALIRQRLAYEAKILAEKLAREKAERERLARKQQVAVAKKQSSPSEKSEGFGVVILAVIGFISFVILLAAAG